MKTQFHFLLITLGLGFALLLPAHVIADGGGGSKVQAVDPDFANASIAIQANDWDKAIELLNASVAHNNSNADAHNLLGYAERKRGNLDVAFKHYDRALALDPQHRGAHEYVGEAYLMVDNLPKAEEHLAALDKICFFSCEEYRDLKTAIAAYKKKHGN